MRRVRRVSIEKTNNPAQYQPLLFWTAVATACLSLLPISVGALVTTLDAGMAFADWPSSDGQNMLTYPWLESFGDKDKFIEHGHRLAGALIGLMSIALVAVAFLKERRRWVQSVAVGVLLSVIVQGILGGTRVLQNDPRFAMFHGLFAALVFSLMASLALFTSRSWLSASRDDAHKDLSHLKPLAIGLPALIICQHILGGMLRHLGRTPFEHMFFAVVVMVAVLITIVHAHRTGIRWIRRPAWLMGAIVLIQAGLGLGAWATKFGLSRIGYVAVYQSPEQVILHSAHTVNGMLLLMTSVVFALRVFRLGGTSQPAAPVLGGSGAMQPLGGAR